MIDSFAELTLETRDLTLLERFYRQAFEFDSIYVEDPAGNVVEVWDFFRRGEGSREGVDALR